MRWRTLFDTPSADSVSLEVIERGDLDARRAPPIVFVHGGCLGAWCWEEHYLEFFAAAGFRCAALSLRGHGSSTCDRPLRTVRLADYEADVCAVIDTFDQPPIVVGHSLGGTVVQRVSRNRSFAALVLMASNPPTGTLPVALRAFRKHPSDALAALAFGRQLELFGSVDQSSDWFFASNTPRSSIATYAGRLQEESTVAVAQSLRPLPPLPGNWTTPTIVMAGEYDVMITPAMAEATARRYGTEVTVVPAVAHCMMLDREWRTGANILLEWLNSWWS